MKIPVSSLSLVSYSGTGDGTGTKAGIRADPANPGTSPTPLQLLEKIPASKLSLGFRPGNDTGELELEMAFVLILRIRYIIASPHHRYKNPNP